MAQNAGTRDNDFNNWWNRVAELIDKDTNASLLSVAWAAWAAAREVQIETDARILEGGSFIHENAPDVKLAKQAAAAIRNQLNG